MTALKYTQHVEKNQDQVRRQKDKDFVSKLENSVLHAAGLAGVYYAGPWQEDTLHLPARSSLAAVEPVPPNELRHWYNIDNDERYLKSGASQALSYKKAFEAEAGKLKDRDRVAELGCSAGRIIRWFADKEYGDLDVWGFDIDSAAIMWAQRNLDENIKFITNTTSPHLPVRDSTFQLIYGNSLMTHVGELSDAWLAEISRVVCRNRGLAIFTFNEEQSIEVAKKMDPSLGRFATTAAAEKFIESLMGSGESLGKYILNSSPWQQSVWYSREFLEQRLSKFFSIENIMVGFNGHQTGFVLRPN